MSRYPPLGIAPFANTSLSETSIWPRGRWACCLLRQIYQRIWKSCWSCIVHFVSIRGYLVSLFHSQSTQSFDRYRCLFTSFLSNFSYRHECSSCWDFRCYCSMCIGPSCFCRRDKWGLLKTSKAVSILLWLYLYYDFCLDNTVQIMSKGLVIVLDITAGSPILVRSREAESDITRPTWHICRLILTNLKRNLVRS